MSQRQPSTERGSRAEFRRGVFGRPQGTNPVGVGGDKRALPRQIAPRWTGEYGLVTCASVVQEGALDIC
jgi:hypothetical protein